MKGAGGRDSNPGPSEADRSGSLHVQNREIGKGVSPAPLSPQSLRTQRLPARAALNMTREQSTNSAVERRSEQSGATRDLTGLNLAVEHRSLDQLIPYARNARTHSPAQVEQIAASIQAFGWTNPILIDGENGIIAGHGRLLAAKEAAKEL